MREKAINELYSWMPGQRESSQDYEKIKSRRTLWETDIFLRGRVELFIEGWVSWWWVSNRDDTGSSEVSMPGYNTLKNRHFPERKDWVLYQRMSGLALNPKEGWRRSSALESNKLCLVLEGVTQQEVWIMPKEHYLMRRMIARQTKEKVEEKMKSCFM